MDRYKVIGFISSGTYGRVYKATGTNGRKGEFAIKKFKPDKEGEAVQYSGISQSACREMALCSELSHRNVIRLVEIILEEKCIFMVFEYAEHDLLQIVHHHTQPARRPIPVGTVKSILFQLLNGLVYLHGNWVLHRDLKPANIMVTSAGEVKIGDLGLARVFYKPLHSLYAGDKVVVTIWYRAPELLLGSKHYTPAVDMWAVGCIFAELLNLRPIFKGEEAKMDGKKTVPFQRSQVAKIVDILGMPTKERWPTLVHLPEYHQLAALSVPSASASASASAAAKDTSGGGGAGSAPRFLPSLAAALPGISSFGKEGYQLLTALLEYDPEKRLTARAALQHPFFSAAKISSNCFDGLEPHSYPNRRVSQDDHDIRPSGTKRSALPDDSLLAPSAKRVKGGG
ncbi:MAG: cyclin-dependent protein kinase [Phylliscum demangeonii]|nr:MAG: cyclin-dependent protein kinase [Phylliscum demangeonii]